MATGGQHLPAGAAGSARPLQSVQNLPLHSVLGFFVFVSFVFYKMAPTQKAFRRISGTSERNTHCRLCGTANELFLKNILFLKTFIEQHKFTGTSTGTSRFQVPLRRRPSFCPPHPPRREQWLSEEEHWFFSAVPGEDVPVCLGTHACSAASRRFLENKVGLSNVV